MPSTEDQLVGPIIAERKLSVRISEGEIAEVVVRLAAPEREQDGCYRCAWEFVAPDYREVRCAFGFDGFQAIHLATTMIGSSIRCFAQENGYRFTWEGSDDIGFPDFHA